MSKKQISLNEFPLWSPWPRRLLGLDAWKPALRDLAKVEREYNQDKYGACLAFYNEPVLKPTIDSVKEFELGKNDEDVCILVGGDLKIMPLKEARSIYYDLIASEMLPELEDGTTVVELGCGYGYNLSMIRARTKKQCVYRGGEYSPNAVTLAGHIFPKEKGKISVGQFNFYDTAYPLLEKISGPIVLFTAHAIEQLPDVSSIIKTLMLYRDKIKMVIHYEPLYEAQGNSLLELMSKRYLEVNDYNRNLLSELKNRAQEIEIVHIKENVMGLNPLNPTSVIKWKFV